MPASKCALWATPPGENAAHVEHVMINIVKQWKCFLNRTVYLDTDVNAKSVLSQQCWDTNPVGLVTCGTAIRRLSYVNRTETLFGTYCSLTKCSKGADETTEYCM